MTDDAAVEYQAPDPRPGDFDASAGGDAVDLDESFDPDAERLGSAVRTDSAPFEPTALHGTGPSSDSPALASLSLLHDVDMEVTVELGRTTMPIRELLSLQPGMVVEIERDAGAPIDVLVNGRLIAWGEVVVIDEEFGIRITEIATPGNAV